MEKRVILSALIILFASFLAFNFGEDNPTGLAHGNSVPSYVFSPVSEYGLITSAEYTNLQLAASTALGSSGERNRYHRNLAEDVVSKYHLERFDTDGDGIISYAELKDAYQAYIEQFSGESSVSETTTSTSCSLLEKGKQVCGIERNVLGIRDIRPILTCDGKEWITTTCSRGQTCTSTYNLDPLYWKETQTIRCINPNRQR